MKFQVQMKDPDVLQDAIQDAVKAELAGSGLPQDEQDILADARRDKAGDVVATWFRYGEYLTVEIDTDAKTCVVLPAR